jgi:hypothetical protein
MSTRSFLLRRCARWSLLLTLCVLAACGGGGVDYPAPVAASAPPVAQPPAVQRTAVNALALAKAQPLMVAIAAAVASGQRLTEVHTAASLPSIALPSGDVTEVRIEHGGTIVMTLTLPDVPQLPAWVQAVASGSALPVATLNQGQLFWTPYLAAPGVLRWYCFGSYEGVESETGGACLFPGYLARGVSWGTIKDDNVPILREPFGVSWVDCGATSPPTSTGIVPGGCYPYDGDTHVFRKLPVLCLRKNDQLGAPSGWPADQPLPIKLIRAEAAITLPVLGIQLLGRAPGDALCEQSFGVGWQMASFEDSGQSEGSFYRGAGMYVFGRVSTQTRFWVRNSIGFSNPWCSGLTGFPCGN